MHGGKRRERCRGRCRSWSEGLGRWKGRKEGTRPERLAVPEPRMPELTRRRSEDRHDCWHIYYGDVQAGTIVMHVGNPHDTDQWERVFTI
jgi:hypothetical protein